MRILHCSDLHCQPAQFEWVIRASENYDMVCLTGDLLDLNPYRPLTGQIELVSAMLLRIPVPLALCSGNHDSLTGFGPAFEQAAWMQDLREKNVWVDSDRFELGGHRFRSIPWHGSQVEAGPDEIWLIHSPPGGAKTGIVRGGVNFGDVTFGEQCQAGEGPWLALSGHIHEPQSWYAKVGRTWSLNPGYAEKSAFPNYISIDLTDGIADLHKASGVIDSLHLWP